ncbi:hypothetical protein LguiA_035522 [Lonicera macranthoides]
MKGPLGAVIGKYPPSDGNAEMGGNGGIIRHNRKCTDLVFLFIFIAFWVAMIVNSSSGFNQGNPLRLNYGLDYKGNLCGDKHGNPDLRQLQLRYWLNPDQVYQSGLKNSQFKLRDARTICLMDCPIPSEDSLNWVCDYPEGGDIRFSIDNWINRKYDYFADLTPEQRNTSLQLQGPCYPVIFPTINALAAMGGVSINEDILIDKSIHGSINSRSSVLKRYMADVRKAWPVLIVCGGIVPLFLSVIWLLMIRHFVTGMPWITVALFNLLTISVTMFYYLKAGWIGKSAITPIIGEHDPYYHASGRELNHIHAAAVLMTIVMIVAILSSIAIVRRILMATSVLKASYSTRVSTDVAAKVIGEVQALIIFPVIPYIILAIFYMFWLSAALHLFSSGQVLPNDCSNNCCAYDLKLKQVNCDRCCGYSIHYTPHIAAAIIFHLFGCYWATKFFIAFSSTAISGSVASYYWAGGATSATPFNDKTLSFINNLLVVIAVVMISKFHRLKPEIPFVPVFSSVKRLLRYSLGSVALGSLIVSFIESIRFMLEGTRRKLKVANTKPGSWIGRVVYYSSQFCLRCVEWTIKSVNHNAYIVACWGLGYVGATLFFGVVEISIETIILSFCQDSEQHQGTARYAPPLLIETLSDQNQMQRLTQ